MRTNIKLKILLALSIPLFSTMSYSQVPDTVRLKEAMTPDTEKVEETTEIQETKPAPVYEEPKDDKADMKRFEFGLRYMPTFSSLALRSASGDNIDGSLTLSHGFGVMLGINFSKNIGLQGEVNYNSINQKYTDRNLERQVDVSYLNLPVLLSINTDKSAPVNLNLVVGPQFGLNIGSSVKTTGSSTTETVKATIAVKEGDVGAAYGAGLEFMLNPSHTIRLDLGFRGYYGFVDMDAENTSPDTYNVLIRASRKTYAGYAGLTFCF